MSEAAATNKTTQNITPDVAQEDDASSNPSVRRGRSWK